MVQKRSWLHTQPFPSVPALLRLWLSLKPETLLKVTVWSYKVRGRQIASMGKAKEMAKCVCKEEDEVDIEMWMVRRIKLWRTETTADKMKVVHGKARGTN